MTMSDDRFDSNPYRSPEWPSELTAADSGLLTKPIHLKGTLSLDEVLCVCDVSRTIMGFVAWGTQLVALLIAGFVGLVAASHHSIAGVVLVIIVLLWGAKTCLWPFLIVRWLKRLCREQRSVFAYREVTITDEVIETKSGQEVAKTPWTDYACYHRQGNTIWLHLAFKGLKRRQEQGGTEERQSRFGVNFQAIAIFPRRQFENNDAWERFVWVVKHKLRRKL